MLHPDTRGGGFHNFLAGGKSHMVAYVGRPAYAKLLGGGIPVDPQQHVSVTR